MILIMGSSRDDLLYFDSITRNKTESVILDKYPIVTGTIFNQNVLLVREIYTSLVSSMVCTYIFNNYDIMAVIMVGKCRYFNAPLKTGDIAVSTNIIPINVDQIDDVENVKIGQVPGFAPCFNQSSKLLSTLNMTLSKLSLGNHFECTFLSSDTIYNSDERLKHLINEGKILGIEDNVVFDCESAGAALACTAFEIPFIAVKVVECSYDKKCSIDTYLSVLKKYSSVGKAVMSFIGEIGRSDLIDD